MTNVRSTGPANSSLTRDLLYAARYCLGSRRALLTISAIAIVAGFALNWEWLVAAGIAPILVALLPCAIMCGLGLCMHKKMAAGFADCCATGSSQPSKNSNEVETVNSRVSRPIVSPDALGCCHGTAEITAPTPAEKVQIAQKADNSGA